MLKLGQDKRLVVRILRVFALSLPVGVLMADGQVDALPAQKIEVRTPAELFSARDRLRCQKPLFPVDIELQPGRYFLDRPLELEEIDSGTDVAPIRYVAPRGGVVLTSAKIVPAARFSVWKGNILVADISDLGVQFPSKEQIRKVAAMPAPVPEVFVHGVRLRTANWPNNGKWSSFTNFVERGVGWDVKTATDERGRAWSAGVFGYEGVRPARWVNAPYLWVQGYFRWDWRDNLLWMKRIDPVAKTIALGARATYGLGPGNPSPRRWRAIHLLEELDEPGEYYVDFNDERLYLWPPERGVVEIVAGAETLIKMTSVAHVELKGVNLQSADAAITGTRCSHITLRDLRIGNVKVDGISMKECDHVLVESCDICEIGGCCMTVSGGNRKTLESAHNVVRDCTLGPAGVHKRTGPAGFLTWGVGTRFEHNVVCDMPHHAIQIGHQGGNDCVFAQNIITNCCNDSDDAAAFYKGRNPSACGNVLEGNVFVDCGKNGKHGTCAAYFDDGDCGDVLRGNVFIRCGNPPPRPDAKVWGAVFFNGGYAFTCEDNVFIDCEGGSSTSGADGWATDEWWRKHLQKLEKRLLNEVCVTGVVYRAHYPWMKDLLPGLPDGRRTNWLSRCTFIRVKAPAASRSRIAEDCRVLGFDDGARPAASRTAGLLTCRGKR